MFQWQPVRTQRFLAPSALLSTFPPPWLGASELLGTEGLWLSISMVFPAGLPSSPPLALRVGEVFSIRVPSLSLCLKRNNLQGSWFDYVCWMAGGSDELVRPQRWVLFLVPTWCPTTLLTRLLLEFDGGDGLVADSPPLRQVVPVYRLPEAGEAFLAPHLTWPVM